jgi:hypothetical protein
MGLSGRSPVADMGEDPPDDGVPLVAGQSNTMQPRRGVSPDKCPGVSEGAKTPRPVPAAIWQTGPLSPCQ